MSLVDNKADMKHKNDINLLFNNELRPSPQISPEKIKELQELYKNKFDIILSEQEALDSWIALLTLMKASLRLSKK